MTRSRCNGVLLTLIIICLQTVTDAYILKNYTGERRTGVFIFLLIGDVCLVLLLRYIVTWAVQELKGLKRACSILLWFLTVFITQIKTYFIIQSLRVDIMKIFWAGFSFCASKYSFKKCF